MSRQVEKGTKFETAICGYLSRVLGATIERRAKHGTNDTGDISGVFIGDKPVVIEAKDRAKLAFPQWLDEAEVERENADAEYGVVVAHRKGKGASSMGEQYVVMTLETFAAIIAGGYGNLEE